MRRVLTEREEKLESVIALKLALSGKRKRPIDNFALDQNDHTQRRKVDPRKWERPPPGHKVAEAKMYCEVAWLLFQGRVTKYDQDERDPQEWGYDTEGRGDQ
jgi:hypothetical protein